MTIKKSDAIRALVGGQITVASDGSNPIYHDGQTAPTEKAIQEKFNELNNAEPMRLLRKERNRKIALTDWRASSVLTLSNEWATYRQALRDLPATAKPKLDDNENLQNVTWPDEPT